MLCNLKPAGIYLMEDFYYSGGLRGDAGGRWDMLHLDCMTANGKTWARIWRAPMIYNEEVIRRPRQSAVGTAALAVLRGNLAPMGR